MSVRDLLKPLGRKGYSSVDDKGPVLPYDLAAGVWDRRIGDARVQAKNWRLAFFGSLIAIFMLIGGLIYQNSRITIEPYFIAVDNASGMPMPLGTPADGVRNPRDNEIAYFVAQFVRDTRGCTLDPVFNRQNWSRAYKMLQPAASAKLDDIISKEKPFDRFGKESVDVKINSVVPATKATYQVRWTETVYNLDGRVVSTTKMTGLFTIVKEKPKPDDIRINPFGLGIKDFAYSKEI